MSLFKQELAIDLGTAIVFLRLFSDKIRLILSIVVCSMISLLILIDILDDTVFDSIRKRKINRVIENDENELEDIVKKDEI